MFDAWVAECPPCKWRELHKTQDGAIGAAEEHVFTRHRKVARRGAGSARWATSTSAPSPNHAT
jgi:hypothetical protein